MRLIFMGSPEFAVPSLKCLVRNGWEVAAVYTQTDKPSGRGRTKLGPAVKQEAQALGLPVYQPASLKDSEMQSGLAAFKPDIVVVAAYGQILPPAILALPRFGCLNIHPSLLPRHRGAAPVAATIISGDVWAGTTVMLMDEGLDTGPVLARAGVLVRDDDNTGTLAARLSIISASLLLDVMSSWVRGEIKTRPQDSDQATYFKPLAKQDGEINWTLPAIDIWRRVRAFQPWPGAFTHFQGRLLKVLEARPAFTEQSGVPGQVVEVGGAIGVVTGHGVLAINSLQLEGKKAVAASDFVRGQRQFIGTVLKS